MYGMDARTRLVDAAKLLIWRDGISATSPGAVLRESGVGQGSLYHHFAGKPDLATAVTAALADDLRAVTDAVLGDAAVPPLDRVRRYLDLARDATAGCRLGRLAFDSGHTGLAREPARAYFTDLRATLTGLLVAAFDDGDLVGAEPDALAATVVACVQGGYVLAAATGDADALAAAARGLHALLDTVTERTRP